MIGAIVDISIPFAFVGGCVAIACAERELLGLGLCAGAIIAFVIRARQRLDAT